MSLKAWRAALADAIGTELGLTVYPWNAPSVDPPCVVIDQGDPYLTLSDEDSASFTMHTTRWSLWVVVRHASEAEALDSLDDYLDGLLPALRSVTPPDGTTPELETVDAPTLLQIGGIDYLVARCTVSTLRNN